MKRSITALLLAIIFSFGLSSTARAFVIYSTFGPGDTYSDSYAWYTGSLNNNIPSFSFTPSVNGKLSSIELAVSLNWSDSGPQDLTIDLRSDSGGLPGTVIDSFSSTVSTNRPDIEMLFEESVLMPTLNSSSVYWLTAMTSPGNYISWRENIIGATSDVFLIDTTGSYFYDGRDAPAFRINGTPVPEPSTILLLGGGLAGLGFLVRQRKKGELHS